MSFISDDDKLREECGLFGVYGHPDSGALTALGLHSLQHRGQEAAGIVSFDGKQFHLEKHRGLIGDSFTKQSVLDKLKGFRAIGHTRYSTSGGDRISNIQPFFAEFFNGKFAVAHNGNITNAGKLQRELKRKGAIFHSTSDTEVILHLLAMAKSPVFLDRLKEMLNHLEGAFCLVGISTRKMIGCRDPFGLRPLVLGDLDGAYILASESCALDIIGAKLVRDIEPGELVIINDDGLTSFYPFKKTERRFCIFEYVYFARPDSTVEGKSVYDVRKAIGHELATESPCNADIVVPVPDSGTPAAIGFAQGAKLPFELGIIRNHYVGRTFIQPNDSIRNIGVKLKHNANQKLIEGKRVVLVDDSIVRGTTSRKIVQMVREAGAREIHLRIASPPTKASCFYGVDTPRRQNLLASRMGPDEMRKFIGADSLAFVSIEGLYRAAGEYSRKNDLPQYCDACFSGEYPTRLTDFEESNNPGNLSFLMKAKG